MKPRAQTKISPHGILSAAGALACGGTIAGFFDFYWWPIEMVSPFRLQFAFGLTALAAMFAWWRSGKAATVFSLFALANVAVVFVALPMGNHRPSPAGPGLRAVLLNVHTENRRHDLVQAFLTQCDADLIVLEEVNSVWISRLAGLLKTHPHSVIEAREDNFGIALFSKLPIDRFEILDLGEVGVPSIAARVVVEGRTLTVLATHPLPPGSAGYSRDRNAQLAAIPAYLAEKQGPILLLGDLNATPWCHPLRQLIARSRLRLTSQSGGLALSWPVKFFPLRIPIDHCLATPEIVVTVRKSGPHVGSDHFPLIVDLKLGK